MSKPCAFAMLILMLLLTGCENDADNVELEDDSVELSGLLNGWSISKATTDLQMNSRSMFFVNSDVGFVVGLNGNIYKTVDGGKAWLQQNSGTTLHLHSVFFLNEMTGYVSGQAMGGCLNDDCDKGSVMLKTTNGGETWSKMFFQGYTVIDDLHFFDELMGLSIIRIPQVPNSRYVYVAKTSDGGNSWELVDLPIMSYANFCFVDDVVYIAGQDQKIYKSTDKGTTWRTLYTPIPAWHDVGKIYFINQEIGFFSGVTNLYKTVDSGLNWEMVDFPFSAFGMLHFYSETEGFNVVTVSAFEVGDFPTFKGSESYQTYDGGKNWSKSELNDSFYPGITYFPQRDLGYRISSSQFYTIKRR